MENLSESIIYCITLFKRLNLPHLFVAAGGVLEEIEKRVAAEQLYLLLIDRYQVPIGQQATSRMSSFIASDCTLDRIIYGLIICYFLLVCGLGLFGGVLCSMRLLLLLHLILNTVRLKAILPIFCCYFPFICFLVIDLS